VKITARKPANLVDIFHENHFLWRGMPVGNMKSQKNYKIFKKSQEFFQNSEISEVFFCSCRIANGFLRPGAPGRCKSQPENQQIWWGFSSKSLPLARNPIR
jgi:hypothetical protein